MNLILFEPVEIGADGTVVLADARAVHIREVLKAEKGAVLQVGVLDGATGTGRVVEHAAGRLRLALTLAGAAPEPWADLLLAMPRPKALKRLWPQLAALGVGRIVLLNAARVERDYFDTHWIQEAHYRPLLIDGLMQAGATRLPQVLVRRRFRPFVEDELDTLFPGSWRIVGQPGSTTPVPIPTRSGRDAPVRPLLAVGPEGGWTVFELDLLEKHGFQRIGLGSRILRSDTACVALIAVIGYRIQAGDPLFLFPPAS